MPASGATLPCVRFRRRGRAGGTHVGRLASWSQKARPAGAQRVRACAEAAQCPRACAAPPLPARRLRWRWDFGYLSLPCRGIAAPQPYPDRGGRTAARLVEGADHVLAGRVVDARLAADGRVHGRHHGRRHLRGARLRVASRLPPARCTKSSGCAGAPERRRTMRQHAGSDALWWHEAAVHADAHDTPACTYDWGWSERRLEHFTGKAAQSHSPSCRPGVTRLSTRRHPTQAGARLDEVHAALVRRRGKAGHVADHAAAQRHKRGAAVQARLQRLVKHLARSPLPIKSVQAQRDGNRPTPCAGPLWCRLSQPSGTNSSLARLHQQISRDRAGLRVVRTAALHTSPLD